MKEKNMAIGENLKELRKKLNMTQSELAEKSGVKSGHISTLEQNESDPKLSTIYKLINALGCTPDELLGDPKKLNIEVTADIMLKKISDLDNEKKLIIIRITEALNTMQLFESITPSDALFSAISSNALRKTKEIDVISEESATEALKNYTENNLAVMSHIENGK